MKNKGLNNGISRGLAALLLLFSYGVSAQSLTGTRGLINAPTARMYESGTLAIGMGYVPAKFFKSTSGPKMGYRSGNAGYNTFITLNILPFAEVMFRYSHEFNMNVTPKTQYFPDRMFTVRFKLLNESKNIPSIVFGLQDMSGVLNLTSSTANFYTSTYFVGTKKIKYKKFDFDLSLGYGFNFKNTTAKEFNGVYGGIEIKYNEFDKAQFLIDYDTNSLNLGIQGYLFNKFHTVLGIMDYEPMFILAYRYKI